MPPDSDADPTRDAAPVIARTVIPTIGDTFVDEPERYAVEGRIGAGGMGTVLVARGARLGRSVALKVVTTDRDDLHRRFEREAQVTAKLQHPSIVPVYGSGRREGQPFYVMKNVTGEPLDAVIRKTETLAQRIALLPNVIAVTEAIAYAHSQNVIHRDLKPANILVGAFGETVVIDWGLAKDLGVRDDEAVTVSPYRGSGDETAHGKVMGTPAYMPIEQARGEPVDARADVYALGAILYHVLAGRPPYRKSGEESVAWESMLARVLSAPPEPLGADVPPDLRAIVTRAMARDPKDRYATAGELAEDLRRFQTGQLVGAHRYSTWQLVRRWVRRHRGPVIVAMIAVILLAALGVVSFERILAERARTEEQRVAAVQGRNDAEDLMGFMLVDLRNKLEPLGRTDLLADAADKATSYYARPLDEPSVIELENRALAHFNLGEVRSRQGHTEQAITEFRAAIAIGEQLVVLEPWKADRLEQVAKMHTRLEQDLVVQGQSDAALEELYTARRLLERAVALAPDKTTLRIQLAYIHGDLGKLFVERGRIVEGLAELRTDLAAEDEASRDDPSNTNLIYNRSLVHERIGRALFAERDDAGALAEYEREIALVEEFTARRPGDVAGLRGLAAAKTQAGFELRRLGKLDRAIEQLRDAVAITDKLATSDPTNLTRKSGLAQAHYQLGGALTAAERYGDALVELRTFERMAGEVSAADPTDLDRRAAIAQAAQAIAKVQAAQHSLDDAIASYTKGCAIRREVADRDPKAMSRRLDLAGCLENFGQTLLAKPDPQAALRVFLEMQALVEVPARDPNNVLWQGYLVEAHEQVATARRALPDLAGAIADYRAALELATRIVGKPGTPPGIPESIPQYHEAIGDIAAEQHDPKTAAASYRAALDALDKLAKPALAGSMARVRTKLAKLDR